jgi:predicted MPP superfamily phosphohydrolase
MLFAALVVNGGCDGDDEVMKARRIESSYVLNDSLATLRLQTISNHSKLRDARAELFKVVHISDAHLSDWSSDNKYDNPNNLREAIRFANNKELKINAIASTGDNTGTSFDTKNPDVMKFFRSFMYHLYEQNTIPTFPLTGNHDSNMLAKDKSQHLTINDIHNAMTFSPQSAALMSEGKNYYYSDVRNPMGGYIRFIALDMLEQDYEFHFDTQHLAYFSPQQINWLCHTALQKDMTPNHSVIILTHYPFQWTGDSEHSYLDNGEFVHSWKMVPEILEAFREKTSLTKSYKSRFDTAPIDVDVDFSSSQGEFICHLGGHIHATVRYAIVGLENQSATLPPQQMLLCTNMSPSDKGMVYNKVDRQSNSPSSNAFCIYAIDTNIKKVYITFFGAYKPSDQSDYPEIQEFDYL